MPAALFPVPPVAAVPQWPAVWRANELAQAVDATVATGHATLDAALPGGGWPLGALVELLQAQPGQGEWRLLLPALVAEPVTDAAAHKGRSQGAGAGRGGRFGAGSTPTSALASDRFDATAGALVLVGAPHPPFLSGLAAQGLDVSRLLRVEADAPAARVWACEQALRCAGVNAVLAWLPQVRAAQLRRLQMAAQGFRKLLFVLRPLAALQEASPAVLRLQLELLAGDDALALHILKRRGPPLAAPLHLVARPARLAALLAASRHQAGRRRAAADGLAHLPAAPVRIHQAANDPAGAAIRPLAATTATV